MIQLIVAQGCGITGGLLATLLQERGTRIARTGQQPDAVVCYGTRYNGTLPCLNAKAGGRTKLQEIKNLLASGIKTPPLFEWINGELKGNDPVMPTFPVFGRKLVHKEGKDILPALQLEDVPYRVAAGAQFFTQYVPRKTEYRVFVYRKRHGATYEKVMKHPEQYKYFGCSYRNGFAFELCTDREGSTHPIPREAVTIAGNAVAALNMDFGAVDILHGKDGMFYVLEINSAPGVEGAGRQSIQFLADKICAWERLGFPRRNGTGNE